MLEFAGGARGRVRLHASTSAIVQFLADELAAFAAESLAAYKVPTVWEVRTEPLPRNANGKFVKRDLRDEYVGADA